MVEIRLLGPVEVFVDDDPVDLGGVKQRTVLAVLASRTGDWVSEGQLIHAVWGEGAPGNALRSLQTYISNLRSLLDPDREGLIERDQGGYRLNPELVEVDAHRFEETLTGDAEIDVGDLWEILDLWRGRPLGELADDEWAGGLVAHWERLHLQATDQLMSARLGAGQHAELVDELEGLVDANPLHEPFWSHLMLALYRSGRQADALDAYKRAYTVLGEELGIEPGPELRELEEKVLLQDSSLAAPIKTPNNLSAERTRLIGRESEVEEVLKLLESTRLLTLTGSGGVGKTRLAQAVAQQVLDEYPDGVWFIDLAPLGEADLVMKRIASVLDVEPPVLRPVEEVVVEIIGKQEMLFVLDNCEHLIEAAASAANSLLEAPAVTVIPTSRETLRVDGELAWRVPSLRTPRKETNYDEAVESEAVRLFEERAAAVESSFRLDEANVRAVATLCRHLDGIPLAIELAAARSSTLTPAQLEDSLDQRFTVLRGSRRTTLPRHRTLAAAIDWSYELLDEKERDLFGRLGVFSGPFDIGAAVSVSPLEQPATVDLVESLVSKSLLLPERYGVERRFRMLETLRQYAVDKLKEQMLIPNAKDRLLEWALARVAGSDSLLTSPRQLEAVRQLDLDLNSIRSAMIWAIESERFDRGLGIASEMMHYWHLRALSAEGARWYDQFLSEEDSLSASVLASGLKASAWTLTRVGRWKEAFDQAGRALDLLDTVSHSPSSAVLRIIRGVSSYGLIPIEETHALLVEAEDSALRAEDGFGAFKARIFQLRIETARDPELALEDGNRLLREANDLAVPVETAHVTELVGVAAVKTGDLAEARKRYKQALAMWDEMGVHGCQAHCLDGLAMFLVETGEPEKGAVVAAGNDELRASLSTVQMPFEKYYWELDDFKSRMTRLYPLEVARGKAMNRLELVDFATHALRRSD